jgi:hypothetical protein
MDPSETKHDKPVDEDSPPARKPRGFATMDPCRWSQGWHRHARQTPSEATGLSRERELIESVHASDVSPLLRRGLRLAATAPPPFVTLRRSVAGCRSAHAPSLAEVPMQADSTRPWYARSREARAGHNLGAS